MRIVLILLVLLPSIALGDTSTFFCTYNSYSDQAGKHRQKKIFELKFIVDRKTKISYMVGNNVSAEVLLIDYETQLAFLKKTPTGRMMTTVINRKGDSVHSRNTVARLG